MSVSRVIACCGASLLLAMLAVSPASAGDGDGKTKIKNDNPTPASRDGRNVEAQVGIVVRQDGKGEVPLGGGNLARGADYAPPPPCWYQPFATAEEFPQAINNIWFAWIHDPDASHGEANAFKTEYLSENTKHLDAHEKGRWYVEYCTDAASPEAAAWLARHPKLFIWVPDGEQPPPEADVITPLTLAKYARDSAQLPETRLSVNPAQPVVNLPTWTWLDDQTFHPVHLHAEVAGGGLFVDVEVTPVALQLPTDLPDATLHPASGRCSAVHAAYHGDAKAAPPCGITFGRSSATQPGRQYRVTARTVWHVTWTSSTEEGGALPDGDVPGETAMPVREIHSIVTDAR